MCCNKYDFSWMKKKSHSQYQIWLFKSETRFFFPILLFQISHGWPHQQLEKSKFTFWKYKKLTTKWCSHIYTTRQRHVFPYNSNRAAEWSVPQSPRIVKYHHLCPVFIYCALLGTQNHSHQCLPNLLSPKDIRRHVVEPVTLAVGFWIVGGKPS